MSAPEVYQLGMVPLTAHAFNADRSQVAVSLNSNEAQILTKTSTGFEATTGIPPLQGHDKLITSIDWAPRTNRIVTCSQDRNAFVWSYEPDPDTHSPKWTPTLVRLRLNRAATFVRWSPTEEKFAIASGARAVAICNFDQEEDWWIAKHLKKPFRSTVLSVDWHPNGVLLATGSADGKARVLSAYLKEVDQKPPPTVWGSKLPFNTICGEFSSPSGGWVHGAAFSPSGDLLAFVSHDSTVTIVYPAGEGAPPQAIFNVRVPSLPYVSLVFLNETSIVAAGHDCQPVLFQSSSTGWSQVRSLDDSGSKGAPSSGRAVAAGRLNNEAFNRFRAADSHGLGTGQAGPGAGAGTGAGAVAGVRMLPGGGTELLTVHQNTVNSVRVYDGVQGQVVRKVSTGGVDGRLVIWDVSGI